MVVKVDDRQLQHLRFADDIILMSLNISRAGRMLVDFDEARGKIGLRLNLTKTMFMRNGWVLDAPFMLNGTNISECSSHVYLGRKVNMMNDFAAVVSRKKRAAWGAYKSIEDVVKRTKNTRLRAHHFNSTVLPDSMYSLKTGRYASRMSSGWRYRARHRNGDARSNPIYASERGNSELPYISGRRSGMPLAERIHWATLARNKDEWSTDDRPLGSTDDQR